MRKFKQLNQKLRILLCCTLLVGTGNSLAEPTDDPLGQLLQQRQQESQRNQAPAPTPVPTTRFNMKPSTAEQPPAASANNYRENSALISSAMGLLGIAYRFGGTTPSGFDCSGLMQYIFRKALAINLPRTTLQQATAGVYVSRNNLQVGDMIFFRTIGNRISHVGMYVGNGRFVHSPRTGKSVQISSLDNKYWSSRYATARRVKR